MGAYMHATLVDIEPTRFAIKFAAPLAPYISGVGL